MAHKKIRLDKDSREAIERQLTAFRRSLAGNLARMIPSSLILMLILRSLTQRRSFAENGAKSWTKQFGLAVFDRNWPCPYRKVHPSGAF